MRRSRAVLLLAIVVVGCVPRGKPPPRAAAATVRPGPVAYDDTSRRICEARLSADGARFERVADRRYSSECAIVGGVHLTDIGMPVTNLGPMTCPLADALTRWTHDATQKAATAWLDSPVVRIESFGTYSCRTMNNVPGAAPVRTRACQRGRHLGVRARQRQADHRAERLARPGRERP